jgi:predicted nucleic acid-binding protein
VAFALDNSVLIGWFVPSQANAYTRRCNRRARRESVFVPALWEVEFANVLRVLVGRKILSRHQAETAFRYAARLPLTVDREPVAPRRLFELGERHGISAYDAAYLELAERRGVPLATRDARLARAAHAAGLHLS